MTGWVDILAPLCKGENFQRVERMLNNLDDTNTKYYPDRKDILKAFRECPFDELKVVWVGQDPYHDGKATGICMGINPESTMPPTLRILNRALLNEYNREIEDVTLVKWAQQGVLLLNSALTVLKGKPGTHVEIWAPFIRELLQNIANEKKDIIWVGLGARSVGIITGLSRIPKVNKVVAPHPMIAIYKKDITLFFKHRIFTQINEKLITNNFKQIEF